MSSLTTNGSGKRNKRKRAVFSNTEGRTLPRSDIENVNIVCLSDFETKKSNIMIILFRENQLEFFKPFSQRNCVILTRSARISKKVYLFAWNIIDL